jgi:hypothetical protein
MVIRYSDGSCAEGVIHTLKGGILRATVAGVDDAVEYNLVEDTWISEWGDSVTFEFTAQSEADFLLAVIGDGELACASGGECVLRRMTVSDAPRVN